MFVECPHEENLKRLELHKVVIRIAYLRTIVARVVISRALRPGTLTKGRTVAAADALTLAMTEALAPREALTTPPLEGRTPAFNVIAPAGPRPIVRHALRRAPEHDEEIAVIVAPLMIVLVGMTAGTVTTGRDTPADALTEALSVGTETTGTDAPTEAAPEALISPPLVGRTPALRVTVAKSPRPRVMQVSRRAPVHDVETAVMVLPLMMVGVAKIAGTVRAADTTGADADAPAVMRPPLDGRTPAPRVTVAKSPKPKVMQASTAAPVHDVETAVMVLPEIVRGVARTAGTVRAADTPGKEALTPALIRPPLVGRALAPRVTVPKGPSPRLTQTLRRPLPVHDC